MTPNPHNLQDLDWLAFCYTANELDNTESEQFEARLSDDQSAREALARAVELCQTVTAAETHHGDNLTPAARTRTNWNQRLSWMAVGGLMSLLLALLWTGVVGPTWRAVNRNIHAFSQKNLASAWTETRTEIANVREAGYWPGLTSLDTDDESLVTSALDENMLEEAPTWMTAAVVSLHAADSPTDAVTNQRLEN